MENRTTYPFVHASRPEEELVVFPKGAKATQEPAQPAYEKFSHTEYRLLRALDNALTGGNHLANVIISRQIDRVPYTAHPDVARTYFINYPEKIEGAEVAVDDYELWCAWRNLMLARDGVQDLLDEFSYSREELERGLAEIQEIPTAKHDHDQRAHQTT